MKANIIIIYNGERYLGHADIVSVANGIASVAVKGAMAIHIAVEKESTGRGGPVATVRGGGVATGRGGLFATRRSGPVATEQDGVAR